jgi:hypothetical protein
MLAARMHDYKKPLVLEDIKVPDILSDQVLVRVGGAGMCRSDVQLIDGYFAEALKLKFPITPGHEIAGLVAALGDRVPESTQLPISSGMLLIRKSSAVDSARAADGPRWLVSRTTKTYEPYPKLRTRLTSPHDQTPLCSCMRRCKKPFSSVHTFAGS